MPKIVVQMNTAQQGGDATADELVLSAKAGGMVDAVQRGNPVRDAFGKLVATDISSVSKGADHKAIAAALNASAGVTAAFPVADPYSVIDILNVTRAVGQVDPVPVVGKFQELSFWTADLEQAVPMVLLGLFDGTGYQDGAPNLLTQNGVQLYAANKTSDVMTLRAGTYDWGVWGAVKPDQIEITVTGGALPAVGDVLWQANIPLTAHETARGFPVVSVDAQSSTVRVSTGGGPTGIGSPNDSSRLEGIQNTYTNDMAGRSLALHQGLDAQGNSKSFTISAPAEAVVNGNPPLNLFGDANRSENDEPNATIVIVPVRHIAGTAFPQPNRNLMVFWLARDAATANAINAYTATENPVYGPGETPVVLPYVEANRRLALADELAPPTPTD